MNCLRRVLYRCRHSRAARGAPSGGELEYNLAARPDAPTNRRSASQKVRLEGWTNRVKASKLIPPAAGRSRRDGRSPINLRPREKLMTFGSARRITRLAALLSWAFAYYPRHRVRPLPPTVIGYVQRCAPRMRISSSGAPLLPLRTSASPNMRTVPAAEETKTGTATINVAIDGLPANEAKAFRQILTRRCAHRGLKSAAGRRVAGPGGPGR